jgi:hypothetical protein
MSYHSQIVMFDPTLSLTGEYKVGLVFQVLVAMGDKKLNCVAVGGRYDALVSDFEQKRASVPQPAMDGCSKDGYPVRPVRFVVMYCRASLANLSACSDICACRY